MLPGNITCAFKNALSKIRMCFQESECSYYIEASQVTSLYEIWTNLYFVFESPQKKKNKHSIFLKEILTKILVWNSFVTRIDNVTYYFLISSKNLKAVYLSFHWFNHSWTPGFELGTRGFELVTRGFELITRGFEFLTRESELLANLNS